MWSNIVNTAQSYATAAAENVKQGVQATQKYLEQMDEDLGLQMDEDQKLDDVTDPSPSASGPVAAARRSEEAPRARAPMLEKRQSSGDGWGDDQEDELAFSDDDDQPAAAQRPEAEPEEEPFAEVNEEVGDEGEELEVGNAHEDDLEPQTPLQRKEMEMARLETDYEKRIQQLIELLERTRAHGDEKNVEVQQLTKKVQQLQTRLSEQEDVAADLEDLRNELGDKEAELDTLRQTLNQVQQEYRKAETMRTEQAKMYDSLVQDVQTKDAAHAELRRQFETLQTQAAATAAQLQDVMQQLQDSRQQLDDFQQQNNQLQQRVHALEEEAQANAMSTQVPPHEDSGIQVQPAAEEDSAGLSKEVLTQLQEQLYVVMDHATALKEQQTGLAEEVFQDIDECRQHLESQLELVLAQQRGQLDQCKAYLLSQVIPSEPAFDSPRSALQSASKFLDLLAVAADVSRTIQEQASKRVAEAEDVHARETAELLQRNEALVQRVTELETTEHSLQERVAELEVSKEQDQAKLKSMAENLNVKVSELWEENVRLKGQIAESAHRLQTLAAFEIQLNSKTNEVAAASRQVMALEEERARVAAERDTLKASNDELAAAHADAETRLQDALEECERLTQEVAALKEQLDQQTSRAEAVADLAQGQVAELEQLRHELAEASKAIEELRGAQGSVEELQQENEKLVAKKQKDLEELKRLNQRITEIQRTAADEKAALQEQVQRMEDQLEEVRQELATTKDALLDLRTENDQLSSQLDMLQSSGSNRSETDDEQFIIIRDNYEKETSRAAQLQQEVDALHEQLDKVQGERQQQQDAVVAQESMKADLLRQLDEKDRNVRQLSEQIKSLRSEMEMQKLTNAQLKKEIIDANTASVAKAWQRPAASSRAEESPIIAATDVERGRLDDVDESEKKNSSQQAIARVWGQLRSRCPEPISQALGDKPPSQATLNTALVVYIVLLHLLLISMWAK